MEPITTGMQGAAVEDVQSRLLQLGYTIDADEVADKRFGTTTEQAVSTFRLDSGLAAGHAVDIPCWSALVDASYKLGDRTLYLRMPNFHGADVQALQRALNVLGFACGEDDGYFGPHTEAALQQFQENVGLFADGMAFQDLLRQGPFVMDTRNHTLEKAGNRVRLTQVEYAIMKLFMQNPGRALSREDILRSVWGRDYEGELKIVDVNIRRLRLKIEDDTSNPTYITTVWGFGYKWGA